jgi:hypothetical protein
MESSKSERTDALVDRFIEETWGICDPAPYRQAMSEHFGKAIEWAVAKERQRCAQIADEYSTEILPVDPGGVARLIADQIRECKS